MKKYRILPLLLIVCLLLTAAFPAMAGLVPIAMLPLGYPAEGAHPARLHTDRKPMEQLVKYL